MKPQSAEFPPTRWSLVLSAQSKDGSDGEARRALDELCSQYWFPLYAFARRCGHGPAAAEDLTQGFFAMLLSHELLGKVDQERGRLRSFLLGSFKHFISSETSRANCAKRGGGRPILSLDQAQAEEWFGGEPAESSSPEIGFDRDWADATISQALASLEEEWARRGKEKQFSRLRAFLSWDQGEPQLADAARDLGLTPGAVRVAVHRLRLAFRRHLEAQVAQTVTTPTELAEEVQHLVRILER
jgi:RNA polymerase sigma-70 factor (ECF subfamily)